MAKGHLTPRRAADPDNQTNGKWCKGDPTPQYPGGTCGNYPVKGSMVCYQTHGGKAEQVRRKGRERLQEQKAGEALEKLRGDLKLAGGRLEISNVDAMLWMVESTAWNVAFYEDQVRLLETNQLIEKTMFGPVLNMWVDLLNKEKDRLAKYAHDCLKIGLEAKRVELRQQEAEAYMTAQIASWDALGLNAEQRQLAANSIQGSLRKFRVIEGTG
jgi:hypothetical protein